MIRRIPKRGFHNFTRKIYAIISLGQIQKSGLSDVSLESLRSAGVLKGNEQLLKVLGVGEITKAVKVKAHKFSESAKAKLEKSGSTAEVIDVRG